jgi:hypothetical protein
MGDASSAIGEFVARYLIENCTGTLKLIEV